MKKSLFMLLLMCLTTLSVVAQDKKDKNKNKETVTFDVSMTCNNCKKRIERTLPFEKGVSDMKVDLPNKTVMIVYQQNKTDVSKLKQAIEKLGYEVDIHPNEADKIKNE